MERVLWQNIKHVMAYLNIAIYYYDSIYEEMPLTKSQIIDSIHIIEEAIHLDISNEDFCKRIYEVSNEYGELYMKCLEKENITLDKKLVDFYIYSLRLIANNVFSPKNEIAYNVSYVLRNICDYDSLQKKRKLRKFWKCYVKSFQKKFREYKKEIDQYKIY